jgi:RNA 2',3'-cyclic 3'-phosphodiesterase
MTPIEFGSLNFALEIPVPRLFVGIKIPQQLSQKLSSMQKGLINVRWIRPDDFHITLAFIGDTDHRAAAEVSAALQRIARPPLNIRVSGIDVFGGDKPHALFAKVLPDDALIELQADIERLMRTCRVQVDKRKFIPHVTLARLKAVSSRDIADYLSLNGYFPTQSFSAESFELYSARASTGGGPYRIESSYPLKQPLKALMQ